MGFLLLSLCILAGLMLTAGSAKLGFWQVIRMLLHRLPVVGPGIPVSASQAEQIIVFTIRLPRVILAIIVGGALASAGVVFQGLFRNPMAEPYVIGVSSGAALGATLAFTLHLNINLMGLSSVPVMAFTGGLATTAIVYNLGRVGRQVPLTVLLLAGIAVGSFMSAVNSILMIFNREEIHEIVFWLMGGFSARGWEHVQAAFPYIAIGLVFITAHVDDLNIMLLGEEKAQQLGLNINRVQLVLISAASLVTAAAVSVSGIIGFVGLIIPHTVRLIIGPDHRFLLPAAALLGGIFLLLADTLARTVVSPMELPVGVITSLAGAPFFLYLLRKNRQGLV